MRSITLLLVLGVLAFPLAGSVVLGDEMVLTVDLPGQADYELTETPQGQRIRFQDCGYRTAPGSPMLPTRTFLIALPPGTRAGSVEVGLTGAQEMPGTFRLAPTPEPVALAGRDRPNAAANLHPSRATTSGQADLMAETCPREPGWISGSGRLRKYGYAAVTICPCAYDPGSGSIVLYSAAEIRLILEPEPGTGPEAGMAPSHVRDRIGEERAREAFINYAAVEHLYRPEQL